MRIQGGNITGAVITATPGSAGALTAEGGTLDGVTLDGIELALPDGQLTISHGLSLAQGSTIRFNNTGWSPQYVPSLYFQGAQSLTGDGQVSFAGNYWSGRIGINGELSVGPGITIASAGFGGNIEDWGSGSLVNQGLIQANGGQILNVNAPLTNQGTVSAVGGGALTLGGTWTNAAGSTITANAGTLNLGSGSSPWTNLGTISATDSTVNLGGLFTLGGLGTFTHSGGSVNLTGTLDLLPVAPSGLAASAGVDFVTLVWQDNSVNESGFGIERSTDGTTFEMVGTVRAGVTHYIDAGLPTGTQYFYRVKAYGVLGDSPCTAEQQATTGVLGVGLLASYYTNQDLSGTPVASQSESALNTFWYYWQTPPAPGITIGNYSARYEGQISAPISESFSFSSPSYYGSAAKVWVNGQLVLNTWDSDLVTPSIALTAGQKYDLQMQFKSTYYYSAGFSVGHKDSFSSITLDYDGEATGKFVAHTATINLRFRL